MNNELNSQINNEPKNEIIYDDIDEKGKLRKEKAVKESKIENKVVEEKPVEQKKEEIVYDDIDDDDKIRADEINNVKKARVRKSKSAIIREILEWVLCFVIAYFLYLTINFFIGTVSGVKQVSMLPTAKEGERLIIQRSIMFKRQLEFGQIITFEAPIEMQDQGTNTNDTNIAVYEEKNGFDSFFYYFMGIGKASYIKRIIGMPGDHIVISDDGAVYRNGEKLNEPYLNEQKTNKDNYNDVIVPEGTIFVMGDNRLSSKDSRYFGCIPISKVDGYVVTRIWPLNKMGKLK